MCRSSHVPCVCHVCEVCGRLATLFCVRTIHTIGTIRTSQSKSQIIATEFNGVPILAQEILPQYDLSIDWKRVDYMCMDCGKVVRTQRNFYIYLLHLHQVRPE